MVAEALIEFVKMNSVLYDIRHPSRRNYDLKESLWQEIADKLNMNVNALKIKWKNLRDCYKKHIRANTDAPGNPKAKSYKHWQWSEHMEFLRPHMNTSIRAEEENYLENDIKIEIKDHQDINIPSSCDEIESLVEKMTKNARKRKRKRSNHNTLTFRTNVEEDLQERYEEQRFDAIEHIFLGYAKTIKKLPVKSQINVKMKIAKIIMEEELKCLT